MTPQHPEGDLSGAPTSAAQDAGLTTTRQGEMLDLFRRTDWSSTPLGPTESWPSDLRFLVDVCLSSRFPMLVCWGPDLLMLYNDGYRALLGSSKHPQALGRPVREVWPEVWDVIGPMLAGVASGGPATWVEDELLVVDRNGYLEEAYFTWSYGAVHDENGAVTGILNVATETSAKVLAERRADVSARLLATLADAEDAEDVRRRCLEVLRSDNHDHLESDLRWTAPGHPAPAAVDDEGRTVHVVPVVEPGAVEPTAHLLLTENPRQPWDPTLQGYAEVCASHVAMALSGIRHLEEERRRTEVLTELDIAKSDFFANVSHELRTPLTLIAGPVQDALADSGLDPEQRRRFELIRRNTDRLAGLVDRILDLTRVEAGAVEPHWVEADIEELVAGIAANFRPAIEHAGLEFEVVCDELDHEAYVDLDMFERIVLNLLANALKFTAQGTISLRLTGGEGGYSVAVTDTGIGIAEKDLDLVFDRFRQLDRGEDRRSREGAGIGLSLVRQLVDLMGGTVSVQSTQGQGSTFTVSFPWGQPASAAALRPRSGHGRPSPSSTRRAAGWFATTPRPRWRDPPPRPARRRPRRPRWRRAQSPGRRCSSSRTTTTCASTSRATASSTTTSCRCATASRRSNTSARGAPPSCSLM